MDALNKTHFYGGIALLILEVDGVLTDGRAWPDATGGWHRRFSVRDSIALRALRKSGVRIAILSRASSPDILAYAEAVGFDDCILDCDDKAAALRSLCQRHGIGPEAVAAMIDGREDAWMGSELACVITACTADPVARQVAMHVTSTEGGDGAVRDACQFLRSAPAMSGMNRSAAGL